MADACADPSLDRLSAQPAARSAQAKPRTRRKRRSSHRSLPSLIILDKLYIQSDLCNRPRRPRYPSEAVWLVSAGGGISVTDFRRNNLDTAISPYLRQHRDNPV